MTGTVLILGARGRFGHHAVEAFAAAGWRVRALVRPGTPAPEGAEPAFADATDAEALTEAARGADVIVHAVNPPYPAWREQLPRLTRAILAAARATGATVLFPGNVYVFAADMPEVLTEDTPFGADTVKGRLRIEMEAAYRDSGVRTIVLRAGDFLDTRLGENWFEAQVSKPVAKGAMVYPGPLDRMHAWAFLPDLARAAEGLAAKRADLDPYAVVHFEGLSVVGEDLARLMERAAGRELERRSFPWTLIRLSSPFWPMGRELLEMRYLWDVPHRLSGERLRAALSDLRETPAEEQIAAALAPRLRRTVPA